MANITKQTVLAGATAGLLVVGAGGAAIGANLALQDGEEDRSALGRLEVVTARAELDAERLDDTAPAEADATTPVPVEYDTASGDDTPVSVDPLPVVDPTPSSITAAEAIAIAEAQVGGTLVEVELSTEGGRTVFEVERRLTDGRLMEVTIDAADGTVLEVEQEGVESSPSVPAEGEVLIGLDAAVAAATAEVGGTLVEVELEREGGRTHYEVELRGADGVLREVQVDAVTGAVLRVEEDDDADGDDDRDEDRDDDGDDERAWDGVSGTITSDAAVEAARAAAGGGTLVEVERDEEDGRPVWEVELRTDGGVIEVAVDAVSGAVLEVEVDD